MIEFDVPDLALVIDLAVTVLLPLLVGLVTKKVTNSGVKATLLAALAALTGLLVELGGAISHGEVFNLGTGLVLSLATFIGAVGLHYGLYKPTGITEKVQEAGVK